MEGTWDMKSRCFTVYALPGIAEAYMWFQRVDGVHVLRFTSYECSGFHVGLGGFRLPCRQGIISD